MLQAFCVFQTNVHQDAELAGNELFADVVGLVFSPAAHNSCSHR